MDHIIKKLTDEKLHQLVPFAKDFAALNGILISTPNLDANFHAPITLLPSLFSKKYYNQAISVAKHLNLLYHKAACDHDFLEKTLSEASKVDNFLHNLWQIYLKVKDDCCQKIFLGLNRSDYMIDTSNAPSSSSLVNSSLKQIEFNLMGPGLVGLSGKITEQHRKILSILNMPEGEIIKYTVDNTCLEGYGRGFLEAWRHYGSSSACILFVSTNVLRSIFDQRALEYEIYRCFGKIVVLRRTFAQLKKEARLEGSDRRLFVGDHEVAIVYFRAGYAPDDLTTDDWQTRLLLEQSLAIKCPNIAYALANTKLVQQAMCAPGRVELYLGDGSEASAQVRAVFAPQYLLTDLKAVEEARANPHQFVLKAQRDGGGNNFYDEQLVEKLDSLVGTSEELAFVLMRRLRPHCFQNFCLAAHNVQPPTLKNMVTEFCVYGVFLANGDVVHENFESGHLMCSKEESTTECGILTERSFLDSPYLV